MNELFFPLFSVIFASVFVWFFLVFRLFKLLKADHPEKYEEMGKPTLFWNNSPKSAWMLMKFLFKREYIALGNPEIMFLGNIMFVFMVFYMIGFFFLFFSVPLDHAP